MRVYDPKTCFNPWLGLLMITAICIVMSFGVVFIKSFGQPKAALKMNIQKQGAVKAALQRSGNNSSKVYADKIIF